MSRKYNPPVKGQTLGLPPGARLIETGPPRPAFTPQARSVQMRITDQISGLSPGGRSIETGPPRPAFTPQARVVQRQAGVRAPGGLPTTIVVGSPQVSVRHPAGIRITRAGPNAVAQPVTTTSPLAPLRALESEKDRKPSKFALWIQEIAKLVATGNYDIDCDSPYYLGTDGKTVEMWCALVDGTTKMPILDSSTGELVAQFCVHCHPNVSGAKVGAPMASRYHLKPSRRAKDMSILEDLIPTAIKNALPSYKDIIKAAK